MPGTRPGMTRQQKIPPAPPACARPVQLQNPQITDLVDADFQPEPYDLVFDVQLAPLQLCNFQIVGRWVRERFVDFLFQCLMPFLEFRKMRLDRHMAASLRLITLPPMLH
jgi:hypothetical protein